MPIRDLAIVGCCVVFISGGLASAEERLAVIVPATRMVELSIEDLAQIYMKKRRFWSDGKPIVAINREAGSRARKAFTRGVFNAPTRHLDLYWNRQYFRGVLPPATLASDDAVKRFVALEPNAIGYIRANRVDEDLRVVLYLAYP